MKQFIASHAKAPKELVLDVDATHVPLHGEQERGHFHAYYIGAAIVRNTRRVRVLLVSAHPMKHVFMTAVRALAP